ncbi:MAG: class I SAM-dependent methyltransferase [Verrucomicrobiota bacterium]
MNRRGKWQGMWTIVRLNWPFYLAAPAMLLAAVAGFFTADALPLKVAAAAMAAGSLYFLIGSLGVSHLVYDRSDLYQWVWLDRALKGVEPERMIFCHSGFDETSQALRGRFGDAKWMVLDHYDAARMTEASIRRARKRFPPTADTLNAPYDRWPVEAESADAVFGLLAIHELRSEEERVAWFAEARRSLRHGGRVVIAEHTRDAANFLAFGPGFLHFHSAGSWRRCWEKAGLRSTDDFRVTPWIRIFVLSKP